MYLLVVLCLCILPLSNGQDATLVDGKGGKDVVEAVVDRIRSNCILADDKSFLRRLAAVQSQNGLYYSLGTGGIWQVTSAQLGKVQLACGTSLRSVCTTVQNKFLVDMSSSSMSDLDKPLYSGLAMALLILSTGQSVPAHQRQQGVFWRKYISPSGDINKFVQYSNYYSTFSCPAAQMDLVFVIDASGSVGSTNFLETLTFLRAVVTNMEIGQDRVRIAVVRYASSSTISFGLSQYSTEFDVLSAIRSISYTGGGANTANALETAQTSVFNINQRPTASKVLVLVTDGYSSNRQLTLQTAAKLKADNIIVFTIGIGNVNTVEMHGVASSPSCTHYYPLSAYSEIDAIIREIQSDSCSAPVVLNLKQNPTLVDNTLPNNNEIKVQVIGIPKKNNTTTNGNGNTNVSTNANATTSDTTVVRVDVVCGNLRIYASYDTAKPNSAFFTYETNTTDNVPGWIRAVDKTMNKTLYLSIFANRRFDLINSLCTKPHYNISIDPPNDGGVTIICRENGQEKNCTLEEIKKAYGVECEGVDKITSPCTQQNLDAHLLRFPHPKSNSKYILCDYSGKMQIVTCPSGYHYVPKQFSCGSTTIGNLPNSTMPPSSVNPCTPTAIRNNQFYFTHPSDKTKFIQCDAWGTSYEMPCASGTEWSQPHLTCVGSSSHFTLWPAMPTIRPTTARPTTARLTTTAALTNPCTKQAIASHKFYHPHPNPAKFIQCDAWGNSYVMPCPSTTVWSQVALTCILASGSIG